MSTMLTLLDDPLPRIRFYLDTDPRLRSENTRRGYAHDLAQWAAWSAGKPWTKGLVEEYAAERLQRGEEARSVNRALSAIRWWSRKVADLAQDELPEDNPLRSQVIAQALRITKVSNVRSDDKPAAETGRHINAGELEALLRAAFNDQTATGVRDAAILAVAWNCGPRVSEIAQMARSDYDAETGRLVIRKGKGNKTRTTYLYNGAARAMADWLALRGGEPGPLFYAIRRGGHVQRGEGVSTEALRQMLAKRCQQAGIGQRTGFHDFRRTFAGDLLDAGEDISTIQKLMGHASPVTTAGYDRRPEQRRQQALAKRHVPYYGPARAV